MPPPVILVIGTFDTKADEVRFVAEKLRSLDSPVLTVDVGIFDYAGPRADIQLAAITRTADLHAAQERGEAIRQMSVALTQWVVSEHAAGKIAAVIGIGGSGGTSLITAAMRALPIGMPKLMVSTMASGNVAPYVDVMDITMMYSVVDIAGLNRVSKRILSNAAHAIAGMARQSSDSVADKKAIGMTMFGVTTPCVTGVRRRLENLGYDCLVFHATGTGGRAMEKLVRAGLIQGILDLTTTEVADQVVGGVFPAGKERFDAIIEAKIPFVLSLGALDMVNFGAAETVPEKFAGRLFHQHNAQVTLMRTTPQENREFGHFIAERLNRSTSPLRVLIPEKGVSALDSIGQPFYDELADKALFDSLCEKLIQSDERKIIRYPLHINDPEFSNLAVDHFVELLPRSV